MVIINCTTKMIEPIVNIKEIDPSEMDTSSEETTSGGDSTITDTTEDTSSDASEEADDSETENTTDESSADSEEVDANAQGNESRESDDDYLDDDTVNDIATQFTSHVTKGEFTSPEQLYLEVKRLKQENEKLTADPIAGASDFIKGFIAYEKAGGDPKTYLEVQSQDYSKMEPQEILRQQFIRDNPDLDRKKADALFNYQFKKNYSALTDDDASEEDKEVASIQLEVESGKAKAALTKWQQENAVFKTDEGKNAQVQEEQQAFFQKHYDTVKERIADFKGLQVPVSDNESDDFKYVATPELRQKVQAWMNDPNHTFLPDIAEDGNGNIDYDKMEQAFTILADPESFTRNIYSHGFAKGQEQLVASRKNQTAPNTTAVGGSGRKASESEQLSNQWLSI